MDKAAYLQEHEIAGASACMPAVASANLVATTELPGKSFGVPLKLRQVLGANRLDEIKQ